MPTIYQALPGLDSIDTAAQVYPVAVRFPAPLIAGRFEWPALEIPAFTGQAGEKFVLSGLTLAANIDQLAFSNAIDPAFNNGFFSMDIMRAGNRHAATLAPFRFTAFNQGGEYNANWAPTATENNAENFNFRLTGALIQTPDLVALGLLEIDLVVTANIYRIKTRSKMR